MYRIVSLSDQCVPSHDGTGGERCRYALLQRIGRATSCALNKVVAEWLRRLEGLRGGLKNFQGLGGEYNAAKRASVCLSRVMNVVGPLQPSERIGEEVEFTRDVGINGTIEAEVVRGIDTVVAGRDAGRHGESLVEVRE